MSGDEQNLNPQIRTVEIGIRILRNIKIYPMSMADQAKFTDLLQEAITLFLEQAPGGKLSDEIIVPLLGKMGKLVGENSKEFIKLVVDEEEIKADEFYGQVTNTQMSVIIKHIVADNFEEPSKNALSLFQTIKSLFQWERPSPTFLNDMGNTVSDISTEEPGEKED